MPQMLDLLERAGELAGAMCARALFAAGDDLPHHLGLERTGAFFRKSIGLCAARPLFRDHAKHLRNDVAGALDLHRVADADIEARDLVGVVQRGVLHHDAADRHRFELGDRRERAGAADLDLDILDDGGRLLRREFVRDRPARTARDEAEPVLPVEAIDFVDHAIDVVIEAGALRLDVAVELQQRLDRPAHFGQRVGLEAAMLEPFDHAGLRVGRHRAHLAPGIGEKAERPRCRDRRIELAQRAGCGIARIDIKRLAGLGLLAIEVEKRRLGHVDFAAHFGHGRDLAPRQLVRNVRNRL